MSIKLNLAIIATAVALSACASPTVDTSAASFDETQYTVDLDECRGGTVGEIAATAAFLLSDDAGYITGQSIVADGALNRAIC